MNYWTLLVDYFSVGAHWTGGDGLLFRLGQHALYTAVSVGIAAAIALPIGLWLGHVGRGGPVAVNISNVGRAIPTFAVVVLFFVGFGDHRTIETIAALILFALAPLLTNTYVGMRGVDTHVREAARAMGMSGRQLLRRVELPLAAPLILAVLRIAVVQVIATATIAAYIGAGGLGRFVLDGFSQHDYGQLLAGATLVALFAIAADLVLALVRRHFDVRRQAERSARVAQTATPSLADQPA
jgi:osmoprotectant transport system permease protein